VFTAARLAFADLFSPQFRSVMFKSLALTIAFLVAIWLAVQGTIAWAIDIDSYPWVELLLTILTGAGLFIGLAFLIGPVASIFAGLFTDQIAENSRPFNMHSIRRVAKCRFGSRFVMHWVSRW
jgi:CysZ protein